MKQHRQGDVLLVPMRRSPNRKNVGMVARVLLAVGDTRGHVHELIGLAGLFGSEVYVGKPSELVHPDHPHPEKVQPGVYRVLQQVPEYREARPIKFDYGS